MSGGPDLTSVWTRLAHVMRRHYQAGRQHLLTEDVLRFATVALLEEHGVAPHDLAIEVTPPGSTRGKLDLVIARDTAIEFKFPRDPKTDVSAADTMTMGEMLADVYRLAGLPYARRLAVWLLHDRLAGYLSRAAQRHAFVWPADGITRLELPSDLRGRLPATASALIPNAGNIAIQAQMAFSMPVGPATRLLVLHVTQPAPPPWPALPQVAPQPATPIPVQHHRQPRGVREEILDAINAVVTRAGSEMFTPQEIVDEMRRRGTRYALSTVTTMISSHMCIDGRQPNGVARPSPRRPGTVSPSPKR